MYIDKKSPIPVYYQLMNIIMDKIKSGEYSVGTLIPSERDLSELLGISRMTVRQGLHQLVNEGLLTREKGKGTFVTKTKFEQRNIMSFSELVKEKGLVPSTKVLSFIKETASINIAKLLDIKTSDTIYNIKRLRLASNNPIGVEEVYLPEKFCPRIDEYDLSKSLHVLLKEKYNHSISYVDSVVESSRPSTTEKSLLTIDGKTPVLHIASTYFIEGGTKLLYEKSVYRSDEYKYNVRVYVNK